MMIEVMDMMDIEGVVLMGIYNARVPLEDRDGKEKIDIYEYAITSGN